MTQDLIPAGVRTRLRGLRLMTRRATRLAGIGAHHSRSRGAGLEFAQYRAYEPGDEPRAIDWKLFARSDRFFVREAERESPLVAWVMIDCSASMAQADRAKPTWSRLAAAKALAAAIGEIAMAQGDSVAMVALRDRGLRLLPPGGGRRQRDRMAIELHGLVAVGGFPAAATLAPLWERVAVDHLVIMVSDLFDDAAVALIERLAAAGRDVRAIQMLTVEERDFAFASGHLFRDPETGAELIGDGPALRDGFRQRFAAARAKLRQRLAASDIRLADYVLDETIDVPLRALFSAPA